MTKKPRFIIIHTTIRPVNLNSHSTNVNLLDRQNSLSAFSTAPTTRDALQKTSSHANFQDSLQRSTYSVRVTGGKTHRRLHTSSSVTDPNENVQKSKSLNQISAQQDKKLTGINSNRTIPMTKFYDASSTSSDRFGNINDHHHPINQKKKQKCSRLCILVSICIGVLLIIAGIVVPAVLLTRPKSTPNNSPLGTNYTLRWSMIGTTVAGTGQNGNASNQLTLPTGLTVDAYYTIYITDSDNNRIQAWSRGASAGTTLVGPANGTNTVTPNGLIKPGGIMVDSNGNIYVTDAGTSEVQYWAAGATTGLVLAGNGTAGNSSGQLNNMYGIARDFNSGTLYVADYQNNRIMSYTSGTSVGTMIGNFNTGAGSIQLSHPTGIYLDTISNSLVIANTFLNNIVRWTVGLSNNTLVAGDISGSPGNSSTLLNSPIGITMDPMGNIYVVDMLNHRILFFAAGQSVGVTIAGMTGVSGSNSTLLFRPTWVSLDNQLNIYVTDRSNHRVQKFSRY